MHEGQGSNSRKPLLVSHHAVIHRAVIYSPYSPGGAAGVFGTGTGWPDLVVATIMAMLGISGGWQIVRQAEDELRHAPAAFQRAA